MPGTMKLSQLGLYELIESEAIVLSPYYDSVGVLTIGVGHTANAGKPDPAALMGKEISLREALDMLRRDLAKFEARVNQAFTKPLKQHEFDAAVSFDFNTGRVHNASWVKSFNRGDRAAAVKQIMAYNKPPEIKERRRHEQELFDKGIYHNVEGHATVYTATKAGKIIWSKPKVIMLAAEVAAVEVKPDPKVVKNELKKAGSVTLNATDIQKNLTVATGVITAGSGFAASFSDFLKSVPPFVWVIGILLVLTAFWYFANRVQKVRVNDAIEGRNIGLSVPSLTPPEDQVEEEP